ncbi:molybdopterin-guanine dinucleotide biosynthesis protein MobB [Sulfuricella sp. T08]|uniref:molybdopterin-guanine dinucleotide biosynthesis protein B n=1 Tax=Sulfuricella sp. T08 TaxID=1632857 RepID=UPI0006179DCA|nr:molybdopterin-guanine dinucleotide biosynthesis protein B [Sulfuricella sp. T08]GAO37527.1 molybdopterin-guanine dinucleotide biosynthesis protein MobB [Sulfuricella sp. T08]
MKVFGFAGYSGSGKTTLIEQLIPLFVAQGLKVSLIKHTHHDFSIDQPGKDSYRLRTAGCSEVMVASQYRWALVHELRDEPEPGLQEQLARLAPCDLVLVESFKNEAIAKLEVHRTVIGKPLLFPQNPNIVAIASDLAMETTLPQFRLDQPKTIAAFISQQTGLINHGQETEHAQR